jgi:serine/threonine-protein kinase
MSNGANDSLVGCTLGNRYVVERVLGTGAAGTVYCARHVDLGTRVAIKVLHPRLTPDPEWVERFEREAFATSRLDHPNALRVLDFGEDDGLLYLVTEYVDATDLLTVMEAEWPLSDDRIVAILSQVLDALTAVHEIGIVHRDLKPENILVLAGTNDDGEKIDVVKVCDFGIAKVARRVLAKSRSFAPRLTAEGAVMGTPDYMSPEQAQGHAVDGRSDLYSLGVVLYHLLAGRTPFDADNAVGIALQQVSAAPPPPSDHRNVHPGLEAVCLRAMSKRPEDRFQTAREMRRALREALEGGAALVLAATPATSLRLGSMFSTSPPAVPSLREEIDRHRFFLEAKRQRKHLVFGYAALAAATMTASSLVASRGSSRIDPATSDRAQAAVALVSPPSPAAPLSRETRREEELGTDTTLTTAMSETLARRSASEPAPAEPRRRTTTGIRPQSAAKPQPQRSVVVLSPSSSPIPVVPGPPTDAILIRNEPWQSQPDVLENSPYVAHPPATERREVNQPPRDASGAAPTAPNMPKREAPAPQAPVLAAAVDTGRASVDFTTVVTSAGISGAKVKISLSHVPLLDCYERALRSRPSRTPLDTHLRLNIDVGGRILGAALSKDGDLPGLRTCIEAAARTAIIRGVDTGEGSATVQLRFSPR